MNAVEVLDRGFVTAPEPVTVNVTLFTLLSLLTLCVCL